jgi:hypothetical protein
MMRSMERAHKDGARRLQRALPPDETSASQEVALLALAGMDVDGFQFDAYVDRMAEGLMDALYEDETGEDQRATIRGMLFGTLLTGYELALQDPDA